MSGHLMREPVRRAGLATALVAGAALLSGCTVTGDLWLTAEDLRLDLRVRHAKYSDGPAPCTEGGRGELGLTPVVVEQTDTEVACTIAGAVSLTSPTERENWVNFLVGPAGDDLMLLVAPGSFFPADGPQTTLDLTVHLPGDVVAAGGGCGDRGPDPADRRRRGVGPRGRGRHRAHRPRVPHLVAPGGSWTGARRARRGGRRTIAAPSTGRRATPPAGGETGGTRGVRDTRGRRAGRTPARPATRGPAGLVAALIRRRGRCRGAGGRDPSRAGARRRRTRTGRSCRPHR